MLHPKDQTERARAYLLRFLAHRPRSRAEALQRLQQKGFSKDVITTVLQEAEQKGWLNDRLFARLWIEDRMARHPKSRRALAWELAAKGLEAEPIEQALAAAQMDEEALAEALARTRVPRYRHLEPPQRERRLIGLLRRRGFSSRVIHRVLKKLSQSA
ncbi:MAG: recombination regulator RecX [Candidatus Bipolaricaulota bacterium]|nr:recombination regulator RecX [Candidatus Bipolaricaulota bacterium]MDW8141008.1 regulatory protein RecX [Candidatus Bipolaricaulota bacterium]